LAGGGARGEGGSNPGEEDELQTGGCLPAPCLDRADEATQEFGESSFVHMNAGPRECGSIKHAVTTFYGKPYNGSRVWTFVSISVYLSSLLPEIEAAQRDSTMYTQYFVFHGQSLPSNKKARIVRICLTESMSGTDLLDKSA